MSNAVIPLEWFYETINKRLTQGIKLEDLFLCVPHEDEAEFEFDLTSQFKYKPKLKMAAGQGNVLETDYPVLANLINRSLTKVKIKVFFLDPSRLQRPILIWHKKYPYPKVNQVKGRLVLTESQVRREINRLNILNVLPRKSN